MTTQTIPQVDATPRAALGSHDATRLRKNGRIPLVIYGHKQEPAHLSVDRKQITDVLHHHAHLLEVVADGNTESCLVKDVQWDYLGTQIIHLDLARVDLNEAVIVEIDIVTSGEADGLKEAHTFLHQPLARVEIECLATNIPENVRADVSELSVGASLTVGDLEFPEGVKAVTDAETVVASVQIAAVGEEDDELTPEVESSEEPQVIGKKEEEDEAESTD